MANTEILSFINRRFLQNNGKCAGGLNQKQCGNLMKKSEIIYGRGVYINGYPV